MAMRYNPPPNWPPPPQGWQPTLGWSPDPAWGPPPDGWALWVDDRADGSRPRLLDRPLYKDWIVYLYAFAAVAGINSTAAQYGGTFGGMAAEPVAAAIDVALALVIQALFFLLLPAGIRRALRSRKQARDAR